MKRVTLFVCGMALVTLAAGCCSPFGAGYGPRAAYSTGTYYPTVAPMASLTTNAAACGCQ
jgi:hypothetical protein